MPLSRVGEGRVCTLLIIPDRMMTGMKCRADLVCPARSCHESMVRYHYSRVQYLFDLGTVPSTLVNVIAGIVLVVFRHPPATNTHYSRQHDDSIEVSQSPTARVVRAALPFDTVSTHVISNRTWRPRPSSALTLLLEHSGTRSFSEVP